MSYNLSDNAIVDKVVRGEKDLYRVLVDRYSPMLFHLARSFEGNEEEVKGLVQEIFVKAYTRLDQFGERSKFSTWLYSVAINHCRDYAKNIRRNNRRFSEMEDEFADSLQGEEPAPDKAVESGETSRLLNRAIQKLKPEYAEPLLMKYRDGMSYKAMSEMLDLTESALKVRVHRARAELKSYLDGKI